MSRAYAIEKCANSRKSLNADPGFPQERHSTSLLTTALHMSDTCRITTLTSPLETPFMNNQRPAGGWGLCAALPLLWLIGTAVLCVVASIAIGFFAPIGTFNPQVKQARELQQPDPKAQKPQTRSHQTSVHKKAQAKEKNQSKDAVMIMGVSTAGTIKVNRFA